MARIELFIPCEGFDLVSKELGTLLSGKTLIIESMTIKARGTEQKKI